MIFGKVALINCEVDSASDCVLTVRVWSTGYLVPVRVGDTDL